MSINNLKQIVFGSISSLFGLFCVRIYLIAIFILNLSSWGFVYLFWKKVSQRMIVLHYNVDFGVDLFGDVKNIFMIPALGLFIVIFNLMLTLLFYKSQDFKFIVHLLLAGALLVNLFLILSLGPIYLINFR